MNINTFSAFSGGTLRNQIPSLTLAATTETEFKINTDASIAPGGAASTTIAIVRIPTGVEIEGSSFPRGGDINAAFLQYSKQKSFGALPGFERPGFSPVSFDNARPFLLRLAGVMTPASNAGNTFELNFYLGTSKSGTNIATTGALTGTETSVQAGGFVMEAELFWDSTSQGVNGQFWYNVNAATAGYHTWEALTNPGASIATAAGLEFCASVVWGNAAGGVVAVSELSLSAL